MTLRWVAPWVRPMARVHTDAVAGAAARTHDDTHRGPSGAAAAPVAAVTPVLPPGE